MYLYEKTIKPQNRAAKVIALICLICGAAVFITADAFMQAGVAIIQLVGVGLIVSSIYIASAYLLRQYTFSIEYNKQNGSTRETHDFIVKELRYGKNTKVCHFKMTDITSVHIIDGENKKQKIKERKGKLRYTYNTEFAPQKSIEISASLDDEDYSIIVTYDENLFRTLKNILQN